MHHRPRSRPLRSAWIAVLALLAPRIGDAAPAAPAPAGEVVAPQPSASTPAADARAATDVAAPTAPSTDAPAAATGTTSAPPSRDSADLESLDEGLVGPSGDERGDPVETGPRAPPPPIPSDDDAATVDFYRSLYRPASNPGRLNIVPRITYTVLGSTDGAISGRTAGLSVDLGQSWNTIGYALTLTANLGDINLRADDKVKSAAMIGGGPTLSLGRLALLQRGYLDLRGGYDFFYAPAYVPRNVVDPSIVAQSIAPHGPRLQIHMGLILHPGRTRRTFQGVGVTVGYQALVGSFAGGPMPFTSVLIFGASYWIG